jgi:hypothetical protein
MYRPSHAQRMYRPAHARRGSDVAAAWKLVTIVVTLTALMATAAMAGNPHFVTASATRQGNNLLVSGKVAGLGNETQIHVVVTADAACLNRGGNFPDAENKETFSVEGDFPVQNGKANFSLTLVASFQPKCSPPMSVVWGPVTITVSDTSFTPFSTTISGPGPGGTF